MAYAKKPMKGSDEVYRQVVKKMGVDPTSANVGLVKRFLGSDSPQTREERLEELSNIKCKTQEEFGALMADKIKARKSGNNLFSPFGIEE